MLETHTGILEISTQRIVENYRTLQSRLPNTACGAVLKANAYGFGADAIGLLLANEGCKHFFVAHLEEALSLRQHLPTEAIYVLSGLLPQTEDLFLQNKLIPVLNDFGMVQTWTKYALMVERKLPCVFHIDTGMRRSGFDVNDVEKILGAPELLEFLNVKFIMSHLANSPIQDNPLNLEQKREFDDFLAHFPGVKASLADTGGIYLFPSFHYDIARPGKGLFGLFTPPGGTPPLQQCLKLKGRILQIRNAKKGDSVGYGGTYTLSRDSKLATIGIGFADGYARGFTNKVHVNIEGHKAPLIGSISMDYSMIDVTDVPESLYGFGSWVELINDTITLDTLASAVNTISRELSVGFGSRLKRVYLDASNSYENIASSFGSASQSS